jgi:hypothetical protein
MSRGSIPRFARAAVHDTDQAKALRERFEPFQHPRARKGTKGGGRFTRKLWRAAAAVALGAALGGAVHPAMAAGPPVAPAAQTQVVQTAAQRQASRQASVTALRAAGWTTQGVTVAGLHGGIGSSEVVWTHPQYGTVALGDDGVLHLPNNTKVRPERVGPYLQGLQQGAAPQQAPEPPIFQAIRSLQQQSLAAGMEASRTMGPFSARAAALARVRDLNAQIIQLQLQAMQAGLTGP